MATVRELKATARPKSGKGPPGLSVAPAACRALFTATTNPQSASRSIMRNLRQRIYAGRFLTTIYDIDLDGKKHRVIPRDFQLDPVKDTPVACRLPAARRRRRHPRQHSGARARRGILARRASAAARSTSSSTPSRCACAPTRSRNRSRWTSATSRSTTRATSSEITPPEGVEVLEAADATLVTIVPPRATRKKSRLLPTPLLLQPQLLPPPPLPLPLLRPAAPGADACGSGRRRGRESGAREEVRRSVYPRVGNGSRGSRANYQLA